MQRVRSGARKKYRGENISLQDHPAINNRAANLNNYNTTFTRPSLQTNRNSIITVPLRQTSTNTIILRPQWQMKAVCNAHGQFSTPMHSTIWTASN